MTPIYEVGRGGEGRSYTKKHTDSHSMNYEADSEELPDAHACPYARGVSVSVSVSVSAMLVSVDVDNVDVEFDSQPSIV